MPWDFNATFGQDWQTRRRGSGSYNDFTYANNFFARLLATPALRATMKARYRQTLDVPCNKAALDAMVDAYAAEIAPVAYRDEQKWGLTYRTYGAWADRTDFTTWDEEIAYMRGWIERRWDFASTHYSAH